MINFFLSFITLDGVGHFHFSAAPFQSQYAAMAGVVSAYWARSSEISLSLVEPTGEKGQPRGRKLKVNLVACAARVYSCYQGPFSAYLTLPYLPPPGPRGTATVMRRQKNWMACESVEVWERRLL
jgi:hypothetical protein